MRTPVRDKMVKGAKQQHKTVMEIAQYYTRCILCGLQKLNIKRPDVVQPATGCIDEYIKIIEKLMDTGYAYFAGGNVYFDTSRLDHYMYSTTTTRMILPLVSARA